VKSRKGKFLVAGLAVIIAVGYIGYSGLRSGTLTYVTPSELVAKPELADKDLRLAGRVTDKPVRRDPANLRLEFTLGDGRVVVPVIYHGVVPDAFKNGADVVVEGRYKSGVFAADKLLAKCPSKYLPARGAARPDLGPPSRPARTMAGPGTGAGRPSTLLGVALANRGATLSLSKGRG